eukprot:CAMPEP_0178426426 /NCGR_PEP_ID=MMETSP0689_2-20121128/29229_1 /TAXON_ID=160604 /ORGANISM="Amphidinium massartii, Strain CS-259" /LENGTH=68 /DNA_ID=CAMNT_0020048113 /DNA_START=742 /DNA_END=948 /DNA_ORIENTATION=-
MSIAACCFGHICGHAGIQLSSVRAHSWGHELEVELVVGADAPIADLMLRAPLQQDGCCNQGRVDGAGR